jgi:hypothetical protein
MCDYVLEYNKKQKAFHIQEKEDRKKFTKEINDSWEILFEGSSEECFKVMKCPGIQKKYPLNKTLRMMGV